LKKTLPVFSAGGGQEGGMRAGTENVAGALEFASALEKNATAEIVTKNYAAAAERMNVLLTRLRRTDRGKVIPNTREADDARFSPYILQAAIDGIPGEVLARKLDDAGFAVSTGSACSSSKRERPVLKAMGVDDKTAFEGIRISQGWTTTMEDVVALCDALCDILTADGM
jgi:cysteine desulfurase